LWKIRTAIPAFSRQLWSAHPCWKKAGFVFEAHSKNNVAKDGELLDSLLSAKTN
jgi:hypothetical protein